MDEHFHRGSGAGLVQTAHAACKPQLGPVPQYSMCKPHLAKPILPRPLPSVYPHHLRPVDFNLLASKVENMPIHISEMAMGRTEGVGCTLYYISWPCCQA